jgi:phenylpropionate dioxygenase-like ring-hydroxylating dioxygenase large terminal subunit
MSACGMQSPSLGRRTLRDVQLGEWRVRRRCPHLKADLTWFGVVDGETLTCQLHGWRYDLPSGRCLTSSPQLQ